MHGWRIKTVKINCRCGLCGESFQNWDQRNEHIADHFHSGAQMKDWTGCRGLDPAVALRVQNAIPPYLIGAETNEFEPFSASRRAQGSEGPSRREHSTPTRFEDLTAHLTEYVRSALMTGTTVTDETVRKQARLYMFGDDDAWNQTPADNVEWLRLFKSGLNLQATEGDTQPPATGPNERKSTRQCYQPDILQKTPPPFLHIQSPRLDEENDGFYALHEGLPPFNMDQLPMSEHNQADQIQLPWAWQTPECLAEFAEMRRASGPPVGSHSALDICSAQNTDSQQNADDQALTSYSGPSPHVASTPFDTAKDFCFDDLLCVSPAHESTQNSDFFSFDADHNKDAS